MLGGEERNRPTSSLPSRKSPYFHVGFADSGAHIDTVAMYSFPLRFLKYALRPEPGTQPPPSPDVAVHKLTGELANWHGIVLTQAGFGLVSALTLSCSTLK